MKNLSWDSLDFIEKLAGALEGPFDRLRAISARS
jgi:hypothetical protein